MKKKMPLAPLILGGICLLLAAIMAVVWIVRREEQAGAVTTADPAKTRVLIDRLEVDQAQSIAVENGDMQISLTRSGKKWILAGDPDTPVRQAAVTSLLERLETLVALREIGRGNLPEYGLDNPAAVLTLDCGKAVYRLCFGNANAAYGGYYFAMGSADTVYLVENALYSAVILDQDSLLELPVLPDLADPLTLSLTTPDGQLLILNGDGGQAEADLRAALKGLTLSHRVDYGHSSDAVYGLDAPVMLQITPRVGDPLTLRLGRGESDDFGYLRLGDSPAVYLFTADPLDALIDFGSANTK